jgi:hypothetical protein
LDTRDINLKPTLANEKEYSYLGPLMSWPNWPSACMVGKKQAELILPNAIQNGHMINLAGGRAPKVL